MQIVLEPYRTFVGKNPTQTNYYQPVLDQLNVTPSHFDLLKSSVLVEGKSDYFIIEYARRVLLEDKSDIAILPMNGATSYNSVLPILIGWGVPFIILLDDDPAGQKAKKNYLKSFPVDDNQVFTLSDLGSGMQNESIEGLLTDEDISLIKSYYNLKNVTKGAMKSKIQLFFSEHLARKEKVDLSNAFNSKIRKINSKIHEYFINLTTRK
ncbi:MAG: TOPRIM nucleotidyl transferase/hydrolase domain-containing protein [Candidatus Arsenophonus phytopathogenicus]